PWRGLLEGGEVRAPVATPRVAHQRQSAPAPEELSMKSTRATTVAIALVTSLTSTAVIASAADPVTLQGAGATFPAPLYQRWFQEYAKQHGDVRINYQPVGSGAGIKQFTDGLVNFGASDAAMTDEQIAQVKDGVVLLPMTAGSVVLTYNLPDVTDLRLSRKAYADIFLGKITSWNDPAIAQANPGVKLPDTKIT